MTLVCLLLVIVSLAIGAPLTWVLIGIGRRVGQMDHPDHPDDPAARKTHGRSVPNTGGIAIFTATIVPILAGIAAIWSLPAAAWTGRLAAVAPHIDGLRAQTPAALGLLAALGVMHVMGLIDDRKRLGPYSKLAVQLAVAAALAIVFDMRVLELLDRYGLIGTAASVLVSVAWMVAITNAMNFMDNMDGLAGGVGAIIAAIYLAATLMAGQWFVAALCALLLGALLGFLIFNFPPAKVFMGDGGSLVLGLALAVISVRTTYFVGPVQGGAEVAALGRKWYGVLMPLVVMAIPLYDFASVMLLRIRQGRSPFVGDQQHFSHRLVQRGLSRRSAVLVIWVATAATGVGGVLLASAQPWVAVMIAAQSAAVVAMIALIERGTSAKAPNDHP